MPGACSSSEPEVGTAERQVQQTDPEPPDDFLSDLSDEERAAELARIAEGTPIEELPMKERRAVEAANARDQLRTRTKKALRGIAEKQSQNERIGGVHQ